MLGIFSSIKTYIGIAVAVVISGLAVALKVLKYQRDKARQKKRIAQQKAEAVSKQREQELDIHNAVQRAERRRRENERAEKKRIDNDVRPDHFGDSRLRRKD